MEEINILELFGGIGALTKAFKRLGIPHKVIDYVEIDKYAVASYNVMNGTNFEPQDICEWDKDIEVDLIMHGSPCQDFSLAGKQAGGDKDSGTRSSLMYETIRIVDKLKPKYVIWENVKNLLSKKHRHNFDAYLETMEQLGYTNYYQVLNAKDYGIPQNRERVFTISILGNENYEFPNKQDETNLQGFLEQDVNIKTKPMCDKAFQKEYQEIITSDKDIYQCNVKSGYQDCKVGIKVSPTIRANNNCTHVLQRFEFPPKQELKLKLKDMLEEEVDEKYYLSEKMIKYISATGTANFRNPDCKINLDVARPLTTDQNKRAGTTNYLCNDLPSNCDLQIIREGGIYGNKQAGSIYNKEGLCPTITTEASANWNILLNDTKVITVLVKNKGSEITKETEISNTLLARDYKGFGNQEMNAVMYIKEATKLGYKEAYEGDSVNLQRPTSTTRRGRVGKEVSQTLDTQCEQAVVVKGNMNLRIRKLTPKECWRLMGFEDEDYEKAAKVNSNTQLYKQAGNSIVVNVLEAILTNLLLDPATINQETIEGQTTIFDYIGDSNE